jgi:hypothetical protein
LPDPRSGIRDGKKSGSGINLLDQNTALNLSSFMFSQVVIDRMWDLADLLVDQYQPGDFNQSLMELGRWII